MAEDDAFPVVVIGAGLAGLSAAMHLAEQNIPPLLLEADTEYAGGRIAGGAPEVFEFQGQNWSFDSQHGIHALWGGYDNMRAMLKKFLNIKLRSSDGEEWINRWGMQVRAIEAGTAIRGTWLPAPFHYLWLLIRPKFWLTITPLDFLSLPGFLVSMLWAVGFDPIMEKKPLTGLGMQDFFQGWTPNLRATFIGLGRSLLAAPSHKISLSSFIAAMRVYTILRRDTWHLEYFPTNPQTCLIQPMLDYIQQKEGMIFLGTRAKKISPKGNLWQIQVEDVRQGITRTLEARHVILALDPPAAQDVLSSMPQTLQFPPALRNAAVRLWFAREPRAGAMGGMFTGDFTIDNFFWLHRMQDEFMAWNAQTGGSAIEVHLYESDALLNKPDELLIIEATKEVCLAFPELRGHFIHGALRRNNTTQTQFIIPTDDSLQVQTPWQNIFACGDWIGYPHPAFWMERCVVTSIAAANEVIQKEGGQTHPIIPARPPEPLARFLGNVVGLGRRLFSPLIFGVARRLRR